MYDYISYIILTSTQCIRKYNKKQNFAEFLVEVLVFASNLYGHSLNQGNNDECYFRGNRNSLRLRVITQNCIGELRTEIYH